MTDLASLTGGPVRLTQPPAVQGMVQRAPASAIDSLTVVLSKYSVQHAYEVPGPQWPVIDGRIPASGADCLVVFDEDGDAWVTTWDTAAALPKLRATLPSQPYDGQEIDFQDATLAAAGLRWRFVYRDGSSGPKWENVGGRPIDVAVTGPLTVTTSATPFTFVALTGGPTYTLPLAGDWDLDWWSNVLLTTGGFSDHRVTARVAGVTTNPSGMPSVSANAANAYANPSGFGRFAGASAGQVVDLGIANAGASIAMRHYNTRLRVMPVRVG